MLILKVELAPGGDRSKAKPMGELLIENDTTGGDRSNYVLRISEWGKPLKLMRTGYLAGHDPNAGGWHLIKAGLVGLLSGRRG